MQILYESRNGACIGAASFSPVDERVIFMHGPENPSPEWPYSFYNRFGAIVSATDPGVAITLDARDLLPPFTAGALRGGTHLHSFSADGRWVAFTYEDYLLATSSGDRRDTNQRNVGVSVPLGSVKVDKSHPRNYDGSHFSVLVTRTASKPKPGCDEISRAAEEAWIGINGYLKPDGSQQKRAIAFQGTVVTQKGEAIAEVFLVDLPEDMTQVGNEPLQGTEKRRPYPPKGIVQRRLTFTDDRDYPGIQGPRHWLRSSPDGSRIAFLMKDANGIVQIWTVAPNGSKPEQLTRNRSDIASAFTWRFDGKKVASILDRSVCITDVSSSETSRLTPPSRPAPRPEACVFSPDGSRIAYVKCVLTDGKETTQIFVVGAAG